MSDEEDASDAARTLEGDIQAFGRIVTRWEGTLRALAFRFSGDRHRAEDLAQSAFLLAFRRLHQWRGPAKGARGGGRFGSWLLATALNSYRAACRSRAARREVAAEDAPQPVALDRDASGVSEEHDRLRRAVRSLPARYRDALVVYYFFEASVEQAARLLGVPEGTLKARLSRGRELLRRTMEDGMPTEDHP